MDEPTEAELPRFRILLIDDNRDAAESMGTLLSMLGHDVRSANDARAGLSLAASFQPDLILSDIGLPDIDGYQLAPALRQLAEGRPVVIAAVTGYGMENDRRRSAAAGFDHHMVKPIEARALLDFVARQVAARTSNTASNGGQTGSGDAAPSHAKPAHDQ